MKVLINTHGTGLGDTVATEPIVRYLCNPCFSNNISVNTPYPELFKHLNVTFVDSDTLEKYDCVRTTTPIFKTSDGKIVLHPILEYTQPFWIENIDFQSLYILRRMLSDDDKQICLQIDKKNEWIIKTTYPILKNPFVIIHLSSTDEYRYFPAIFYHGLIEALLFKGYIVVGIGKTTPYSSNVNINNDRYVNLFDKTDLSMLITLLSMKSILITNDSAPLHIASAFDNPIILLNTIRPPHTLLHTRKGSIYYKTSVIQDKILADDKRYNIDKELLALTDKNMFIPNIEQIVEVVDEYSKNV